MKKAFLLLFTLLFAFQAMAQLVTDSTANPINPDRIEVLADGCTDSIVLRWAPTSPIMWQLGNRVGYRIERLTTHQNGRYNQLAEDEKIVLVQELKPLPEASWGALVARDEHAEIVQEMIYGAQENMQSNDWVSAMKRYQELQQRFGFALFICDFYPDVAQAAALRWVDRTVEPNNRYIYRISVVGVPEGLTVESGAVMVSAKEAFRTPSIQRLSAQFIDKQVNLSWSLMGHKGLYSAYRIERSTDSLHFTSVTDLPFSPMSEDDDAETAFFSDSLPDNGRLWYYRVVGLTPMGKKGRPSAMVHGMGGVQFKARAVVDTAYEQVDGSVALRWHLEQEGGAVPEGVNLYRASSHDGAYTLLNPRPLPTSTTSWVDATAVDYSLYYKVEVLGKSPDELSQSFPQFVQRADSVPPLPPTGLYGKVEPSGLVRLGWKQNTEPDVLGYRVFRANSPNEEFSEITTDILRDSLITDTIYLRTLTSKVYYKAIALDRRYNPSGYSALLELDRPDTIPPVAPLITRSGIDQNGMYLYWEYGPSDDVARYELYRICKDSLTEVLHDSWTPNPLRVYYADTTAMQGFTYQFKLVAIDKSGNKASSITRELFYETGFRPAISNIRTKVNRENKQIHIQWEYAGKDRVDRYIVYKTSPNEPMVLYRTIMGQAASSMDDAEVAPNNKYIYRIKAILENGAETSLSKRVEVSY